MPTVVDSLIIQLGLDPSNFTKGQKDAAAAFAKTKAQMRKDAGEVEDSAKKMRDALGKATAGVFDLMAAFLGGRGIKEFVQQAIQANNALGNLSAGLGSSPQLLSEWGIAAQRMGGSAAATMSSIQALSDSLVDLRTQGKNLPDALFLLEAKSGKNIDFQHGWEKMAIDLANAASTLAKTDPAAANRFLRSIGLDPVTAALMIRQGPRMRDWLAMQKRFAPSKEDIAAAQRMTDAQGKLRAEYDLFAAKVMTALAPALEMLANVLGAAVEAMAKFVEAHPNFTTAATSFLAILAGVKILTAIKNILGLRSAILGLTAANEAFAGGGLLGFLASNPWIAALIAGAAVMTSTPAGAGEDERQRQENLSRDPDYYKPGHPGAGGGRGGSGKGDGDETPVGPMPTAPTTNARLAAARAHFFDELDKNPSLRRDVIKTISMETAGSALSMQAGIESMVNRAAMNGYHSLNQAIHSGFYGPVNRGGLSGALSAKDRADGEKALAAVRAGGNIIGYRTDQGMLSDPGAKKYMQMPDKSGWAKIHGENYFYMGDKGKQWAREQIAADAAASGGGQPSRPAQPQPKKDVSWSVYHGWKPSALHGLGIRPGAAHAAALNNISNDNRATTTSSSNEMHINGGIHVNAPNATDAHGVATHIDGALADSMFANFANYGPN